MITGNDLENRAVFAADHCRELIERLREVGYTVEGIRFDDTKGYAARVRGLDGWHSVADLIERTGVKV